MSKKLPASYREIDCCETCKHVRIDFDLDNDMEYFCGLDDATTKGVTWLTELDLHAKDVLDEWKSEHEVAANGYCDFYKHYVVPSYTPPFINCGYEDKSND